MHICIPILRHILVLPYFLWKLKFDTEIRYWPNLLIWSIQMNRSNSNAEEKTKQRDLNYYLTTPPVCKKYRLTHLTHNFYSSSFWMFVLVCYFYQFNVDSYRVIQGLVYLCYNQIVISSLNIFIYSICDSMKLFLHFQYSSNIIICS